MHLLDRGLFSEKLRHRLGIDRGGHRIERSLPQVPSNHHHNNQADGGVELGPSGQQNGDPSNHDTH